MLVSGIWINGSSVFVSLLYNAKYESFRIMYLFCHKKDKIPSSLYETQPDFFLLLAMPLEAFLTLFKSNWLMYLVTGLVVLKATPVFEEESAIPGGLGAGPIFWKSISDILLAAAYSDMLF